MLPLLGVRVEDPKPWILITFNWNYDYELKQVRKDTDIVIKTQQHSHNFFVIFHNDVNARSNTFIHQLCKKQIYSITQLNVTFIRSYLIWTPEFMSL